MTTPLDDEVVPLLLVEPAPLDEVLAAAPELEDAVPELEVAAPELDVAVPELDAAVPEVVAVPDVLVAVPVVPLLEVPLEPWPEPLPLLLALPGPAAS